MLLQTGKMGQGKGAERKCPGEKDGNTRSEADACSDVWLNILVGVGQDTRNIPEDNGHEPEVDQVGDVVAEPVLVAVVDEKLEVGRYPERLYGRQVGAEDMSTREPIGDCKRDMRNGPE